MQRKAVETVSAEKTKVFIFRWLLAFLCGPVIVALSLAQFFENRIWVGIFLVLVGAGFMLKYIFFVPYSFTFDDKKVTLHYVFKSEAAKYSDIKSCDKVTSGIKNYPFGEFYRIFVDNPVLWAMDIPSTKETDLQIEKYFVVQDKKHTKKKK